MVASHVRSLADGAHSKLISRPMTGSAATAASFLAWVSYFPQALKALPAHRETATSYPQL